MTDIGRARVCVCLCARVLLCDVALAFEELVRCRGSDRPARGVSEKERRREVCVGVCVWGGVCVRERVTRRRERLKSVLLDRLAWHNWEQRLSRGARVGLHRHRRRGRVVSPRIRGFQTLSPAPSAPTRLASPIASERRPSAGELARNDSSVRASAHSCLSVPLRASTPPTRSHIRFPHH